MVYTYACVSIRIYAGKANNLRPTCAQPVTFMNIYIYIFINADIDIYLSIEIDVYFYIHIYLYTYIYIHVYTYACMSTRIYAGKANFFKAYLRSISRLNTYIYFHRCKYRHTSINIHMYIHLYIFIYIYKYTLMLVCLYIYTQAKPIFLRPICAQHLTFLRCQTNLAGNSSFQ